MRGVEKRRSKDTPKSQFSNRLGPALPFSPGPLDPLESIKPPSRSEGDASSKLFKPVAVLPSQDMVNLGKEIAGDIDRTDLLKRLKSFFQSKTIRALSKEQGLDDYLYWQACISFRKFCMDVTCLPPELYVLFTQLPRAVTEFKKMFQQYGYYPKFLHWSKVKMSPQTKFFN